MVTELRSESTQDEAGPVLVDTVPRVGSFSSLQV